MHRVQNLLVDEQLQQIHSQSSYSDVCCYFEDSNTPQLRPSSTHEMMRKTRVCGVDPRAAPAREFEVIRQRLKAVPPYMVVMQYDDDSLTDEAIKIVVHSAVKSGCLFPV